MTLTVAVAIRKILNPDALILQRASAPKMHALIGRVGNALRTMP